MLLIDKFFNGIGSIRKNNKTKMYEYKVQGLKNCLIIKKHFLKYPLMTHRLVNFTMWCKVLVLFENKAHLTKEGLIKLVEIKAAFPKGLTEKLKFNFPHINSIRPPEYKPNLSNLNYYWLTGFINTDGSFFFSLTRGIVAIISIGQHTKSLILLNAIIKLLGFGNLSKSRGKLKK